MNNLVFLSHGIQIAIFVLLLALVLVFIKGASLEHRLKNMEYNMMQYVTHDDYMETFNNMWELKQQGKSVAPFSETQ